MYKLLIVKDVMMKKPQVIALNKVDLPPAAENIKIFRRKARNKKVFPVSGLTGKGVKELLAEVYKKVKSV